MGATVPDQPAHAQRLTSRKHAYIILTPFNSTRRGGSNEYHNLCFEQKYEKYKSFLSENFQFLEVKFSI